MIFLLIMFNNTSGYLHFKNTTLDIDDILIKVKAIKHEDLDSDNIKKNPHIREIGNYLKEEYDIVKIQIQKLQNLIRMVYTLVVSIT